MGVSLFTVRVILDVLGTVDYGLYNVVGGVVMMFSFLSGTMASASQRYFSFELGKRDFDKLRKIFNIMLLIYFFVGILILVLAETIGLWFLNNRMVIPPERLDAANWVYQFSIFSFMMTMFTVPYNAMIIARERMSVYAYMSIVEVLMKLLIVYLLLVFSFDKLKLYSVLMFMVTTFVTLLYRNYCQRNFRECKLKFYWDRGLFKEIATYSGWNLFGALANIFNNHGTNIVLNIFFGPVINTSRAIAYRINSSVNQFVSNFMTATRPQITKYYANGERNKMLSLVFSSCKLSYFLLLIISMPILLETKFILFIWLKELPPYVVEFTRLIVVGALVDSISYPLMSAAQATGKIKKYQMIVGGLMLLNLPLSYIFLSIGYEAISVFYIAIVNSIFCLFARLIMLRIILLLSIRKFVEKVIFPLISVSTVAYIMPFILLNYLDYSFSRFIIIGLVAVVCSSMSIFFLGLQKNERIYIVQLIKRKNNV